MFRKTVFDPTRLIDTVIAGNTSINGHLKCDGNLRIEGFIEGTVECAGHVIIGEKAIVRADIRARNVSVQGKVEGNIHGDRVEILAQGRVLGDVDVIDLLLDEGGLVRGHVVMRKEDAQPQPLILGREDRRADETAAEETTAEGK